MHGHKGECIFYKRGKRQQQQKENFDFFREQIDNEIEMCAGQIKWVQVGVAVEE